ncbi:MAG: hypothetical protein IPM51_13210 [Sphingobacteriaceae bacterium]|nr:hypothetical protein [Sphingobacteriaceae bacterium]
MTPKHIHAKLDKIDQAADKNFLIEAYILHYQLNIELLHQLYNTFCEQKSIEVKPKKIVQILYQECNPGSKLKNNINRKNLKLVMSWIENNEQLFKNLRNGFTTKPDKKSIADCRSVFNLLNISLRKHGS